MDPGSWLEAYARAWREADADAAAALFTEDAVYRSHPFRPPSAGRTGIRAYWRRATRTQADLDLRLGEALVDGRRAAVEWWATMLDEREEVTLPGILVLRFGADGRCEELRECWVADRGRRPPFEGWGLVGDGRDSDVHGHAVRWAAAYEAAWRAGDAEAVVALFSRDAVYRSHPLHEPVRSRDGVRAYTSRAFAREDGVEPLFGVPVAAGSAAAIEYWATLREEGSDATLAGCDVLRFDDEGLCSELRDYWHTEPGRRAPPVGWGR